MVRSVCSLLLLCSSALAQQAEGPPPTISKDVMGTQQMQIYRDFLHRYQDGGKSPLNLANISEPFSPDSDELKGCLWLFPRKGMRTTEVHSFPADAFPKEDAVLVDPASFQRHDVGDFMNGPNSLDKAVDAAIKAGLFRFSEIVFTTDHTRAAFSYSFVCGSLCGHGGVVIYQRKQRHWQRSRIRCVSWQS
jgi:hypothetical protein